MEDLIPYMARCKAEVDDALERELPPASTRPALLHEAMRYSVLDGGKRIRPILTLTAAASLSGDTAPAMLPGLAVEILHAYTLIHDDLPCMDDDQLRRGKPTSHVKYGEANALLAGDALLTLAFEWLARCPAPPPHPPNRLVLELARAAGSQGTIGGQVEDLAAENRPPDKDTLAYIHLNKTAALLQAAVRMGGIVAGAAEPQLEALDAYGRHLGLAFQIIDDVLDETEGTATLGKPAGSDVAKGKMTYPALYGLEASREMGTRHMLDAIAALQVPGIDGTRLEQLARFVVERHH